jgi:hypothetical protein
LGSDNEGIQFSARCSASGIGRFDLTAFSAGLNIDQKQTRETYLKPSHFKVAGTFSTSRKYQDHFQQVDFTL